MKTTISLLLCILFALNLIGQENSSREISLLLDSWHRAAANNDQEGYFEFIDDAGIYIGTDSTEIWTREQFYEWSTPFFTQEKGWAFQKQSRNIYLSDDATMAWFDELLVYGKGTLRGSGVLVKRGNNWRIIHYVLSVPVPNDKYKEVMGLIGTKTIIHKDAEE